MFCTLFWADSFGMSDFSKYGRRVLYILIFLSVTIHLTQSYPTFLKRLLVLLCWTAGIVAIANFVFFYRQHPFPFTRLFGYGLLQNPFKASSLYGIAFIACMYLILHQRSVGMQLFYLGLLLISPSYMLLAQSRSTLLSLIIAMIAWQLSAWLLHGEDRRNHLKQLLILIVLISAASAVFFMLYPGFFDEALIRGYSTGRFKLWGKILVRVKQAPWFGHGLTADPRTESWPGSIKVHPHSVYVGTLLYGGIVGLLSFIAVVISALWQGFGRARQSINLVAACMVLYGTVCIIPNGNMLIHHVKPFWLFFWFPVALVVASEIPGHPLHGELDTPQGDGTASTAAELRLTS
jgi:O-antigen ligase